MKLIRDKYKDIIPHDQLILTSPAHPGYYELKLEEELAELRSSGFMDINEYGDVIEVIYAIAKLRKISEKDIEKARKQKLKEKGGFDTGLLLKGN